MKLVKLFLTSIVAVLFSLPAFSQARETYYDKKWREVDDEKKAAFLTRAKKVNDTCWQLDTYNMYGPLLKTEQFRDRERTILHGECCFYKRNGYTDSIASYSNKVAHGSWYYINDTGRYYLQKDFDHGRLVRTVDLIKQQDSIMADTLTLVKVEKESEFPGGFPAWQTYLMKNLRYPQRAIDHSAQGSVMIQFVVGKTGTISNLAVFKSVELSIDEESLRIIRKSETWTPAYQNGRVVKSYKRQPVVYRLE